MISRSLFFFRRFPAIGILLFTLFSFYLYLCLIQGLLKLGIRVACVSLYPIQYAGTETNSLLVNFGMLLLCSWPVLMFCAKNFNSYARFTTIAHVFNVQLRYLPFFRFLFSDEVFIYALLACFGVSLIISPCYIKKRTE